MEEQNTPSSLSSAVDATASIWKPPLVAEKTFRRLKGAYLLAAVLTGTKDVDAIGDVIPITRRSEKPGIPRDDAGVSR